MVHLTPTFVLFVLFLYFAMLVGVAWYTGRNNSNEGFFLANRKVPWYVVAYAMIGTSISGVTFISIPGAVGGTGINMAFSYMQVVLGYLVGYLFIATVLMPLYYRLNLTSIYAYLEQRFGWWSYKTGAGFFLLARTLGPARASLILPRIRPNTKPSARWRRSFRFVPGISVGRADHSETDF